MGTTVTVGASTGPVTWKTMMLSTRSFSTSDTTGMFGSPKEGSDR